MLVVMYGIINGVMSTKSAIETIKKTTKAVSLYIDTIGSPMAETTHISPHIQQSRMTAMISCAFFYLGTIFFKAATNHI